MVIGRRIGDPARWKRYRGGTAGHLWIDRNGDGQFARLLPDLTRQYRLAHVAGRGAFIFVSDHEGVGNLYSCTPAAAICGATRTTKTFTRATPARDGQRIVYHAGADLYVYDPGQRTAARPSPSIGAARACSATASLFPRPRTWIRHGYTRPAMP